MSTTDRMLWRLVGSEPIGSYTRFLDLLEEAVQDLEEAFEEEDDDES